MSDQQTDSKTSPPPSVERGTLKLSDGSEWTWAEEHACWIDLMTPKVGLGMVRLGAHILTASELRKMADVLDPPRGSMIPVITADGNAGFLLPAGPSKHINYIPDALLVDNGYLELPLSDPEGSDWRLQELPVLATIESDAISRLSQTAMAMKQTKVASGFGFDALGAVGIASDIQAVLDLIDDLRKRLSVAKGDPEGSEIPSAWATADGERVITAKTMDGARKDGGAILSSLSAYSVPLYKKEDSAS